ncbi:MAG: pyrogallol hydroxytransferase large subunit, partial [Hydrogenophaga sp.]|nr:pyrogallol hydroxytransferase large subunit [Hydrogenophaga sp.]
MKHNLLRAILLALGPLLNRAARTNPAYRAFLKRHDIVAQIQLKDGRVARHFSIRSGRVRSMAGLHPSPDVALVFKDITTALTMMRPNPDMGEVVHAAKNFRVVVKGDDALCVWFMQALNQMQMAGLRMGVPQADGCTRFTTLTNGGPLFVHVKNGRIVRLTPVVYGRGDAPG